MEKRADFGLPPLLLGVFDAPGFMDAEPEPSFF